MAAQSYSRARDLPRLIALWPHELEAATRDERAALVAKLAAACAAERNRGLARHWTYHPARHDGLIRAYHLEALELEYGR